MEHLIATYSSKVSPANIRIGSKRFKGTNAKAYLYEKSVTKKKRVFNFETRSSQRRFYSFLSTPRDLGYKSFFRHDKLERFARKIVRPFSFSNVKFRIGKTN